MYSQATHLDFSNVGYAGNGRAFPGIPPKSEVVHTTLSPRQCLRIDLKVGDILSLRPLGIEQGVSFLVFNERGRNEPKLIGLSANSTISKDLFDCAELTGWIAAEGGTPTDSFSAVALDLKDLIALKAAHQVAH